MRARHAAALFTLAALLGCGADARPPGLVPMDASTPGSDVVGRDGGLDATLDEFAAPDVHYFEEPMGDGLSPSDASTSPDVLPPPDVLYADGGVDRGYCAMDPGPTEPPCTTDADCAGPAYRCLPTGCSSVASRCQPVGHPCGDDGDCPAGLARCTSGVCVPLGTACGDTRACPLGYTCDPDGAGSTHCVARRTRCIQGDTCPSQGTCWLAAGLQPFCTSTVTRCVHDVACLLGSTCRDVDHDGLSECVPDGPCDHGTCPASRPVCQVDPLGFISECALVGVCSAARPCASGYLCVDTWGTGVGECHLAGDPCQRDEQCPPDQLCFAAIPATAGVSSGPGCAGP